MLAILLAAGRGRRIGTPKALLDLGGRPAVLRCVDLLRAGGATSLLVVTGAGAAAERIEALLPRDVEVIRNPEPERGQTSSLKLALAGRVPEDVLLHTVDHPLVHPDDVRALLAAWRAAPAGIAIVAPSVEGRRGHPTLYSAAAAAEFCALDDDQPAHAVVRREPARVMHVARSDPWIVLDIDTPEDLSAARRALAGRERLSGAN